MPSYSSTPTSSDPLADTVLTLLRRLKNIDPNDPLFNELGQMGTIQQQSSIAIDQPHGVIGFLIMKDTEYGLLEVKELLEWLLRPQPFVRVKRLARY